MPTTSTPTCEIRRLNSGKGKSVVFDFTQKFWIVPTYDSTGALNTITPSTFNQSALTALINQTDVTKRLYPFPTIREVKHVRADNITKTYDNYPIYVADGLLKHDFELVNQEAFFHMLKVLKSNRCDSFSVYWISKTKQILGKSVVGDVTKLRGEVIDNDCLQAILNLATSTDPQSIKASFIADMSELDEEYLIMTPCDMDFNPLAQNGLLDFHSIITPIDNTHFTIELYGDITNDAINWNHAKGLVAADFVITDLDTAAVLTKTMVESNGIYTVTITGTPPTAGDVIEITSITKTGMDFTDVNGETFISL